MTTWAYKKCPLCEEGTLNPREEIREVEHLDCKGVVTMFFLECNNCNSELAGDEESRKNREAIERFRENAMRDRV